MPYTQPSRYHPDQSSVWIKEMERGYQIWRRVEGEQTWFHLQDLFLSNHRSPGSFSIICFTPCWSHDENRALVSFLTRPLAPQPAKFHLVIYLINRSINVCTAVFTHFGIDKLIWTRGDSYLSTMLVLGVWWPCLLQNPSSSGSPVDWLAM